MTAKGIAGARGTAEKGTAAKDASKDPASAATATATTPKGAPAAPPKGAPTAPAAIPPATDSPSCPPGAYCADVNDPSGRPFHMGEPRSSYPPHPPYPPPYGYEPSAPPPGSYAYEPPHWAAPPSPPYRPEWALFTHIQGIDMGSGSAKSGNAAMGGIGVGLRFRPIRHLSLDFGLDFYGGRDFYGRTRSEGALSVSPVFVVNPQHALQFYVVTGLHVTTASVDISNSSTHDYRYIGMQAGAGLEWRASPKVGLHLDLVGFIRGRIDSQRNLRNDPEFIDPATGKSTNTSGGGIWRLGFLYYWQ